MKCNAASNLLNTLQNQLIAKLDHYIDFFGPDADSEMMDPFKGDWLLKHPYSDMEFEHEYFKGNFTRICNAFEMFHGTTSEGEFYTELTAQMRDIVAGRMQYWTDQRSQENQAVYKFELNQAIEEVRESA